MIDTGHWNIVCEQVEELPFGFIYLITNKVSGRKYIGKKQMQTLVKRKPLKGKKRRRISTAETKWKDYTSSSNELNADIIALGIENFQFDIIRWCCSKSELAYYEAKLQFDHDVLLRSDYYNGMINLRIGRLKTS